MSRTTRNRSHRSSRKRSLANRAGPDQAAQTPSSATTLYPVWDRPTRLIHLGLLLLFPTTLLSVHIESMPIALHLWAGYLLLVLILVRLVWGMVGSDSARFARFVAGPGSIRRYWPRLLSRQPTHWPGHNPIGALYIVAILGLLLLACITGLFFEGWGDWRGPLAERVTRVSAIRLSDLHRLLQWPIVALVTIHIAVVLAYRWLKAENRIAAMFGNGQLKLRSDPGFRFVGTRRALGLAAVSGLLIVALLRFGPVA